MRGEVHMGKGSGGGSPDEFKAETVRLVRDGNRKSAEVARDLGLAENRWFEIG